MRAARTTTPDTITSAILAPSSRERALARCLTEYSEWPPDVLEGMVMLTRYPTTPRCAVEGCERPSRARGWCAKHYQRWRVHGDPVWTPPPRPIPTRAEIAAEMEQALANLRALVEGS